MCEKTNKNCGIQQSLSNENYSGLRLVMRLISMINALLENFITNVFLTKIALFGHI